ncbi:hypothetical protein CJ739_2474 [Mariniflexile rhizosphaerae]|uniref:T9SS type A sorting domain-containing protein n=1 Tax=unclassified Mariniflexile TaxID=2643887 RepID=UPI000CAE330B|nr:T9SS type A sorting domain-containing protein [Mariniflexile sp. TRM1-10]AXP81547.1 hypothetical protein CJ739_2474 [Mariniflexile sp. TRM1-10]PLB17842.1 MAG: hypothetical protein TRG1_3337 [Flavobacteriaceae bacterium FS1-H7996/R]
MNIFKLFSIFLIVLFFNNTYSQTGPGGIGSATNNELWLIAEKNVFTDAGTLSGADGDLILQWNDNSGNANNATTTSSRRPILNTNNLNGYATLNFDGIDDRMLSSLTNGTSSQLTIFVVAKFNSYINDNDGVIQGSPSGQAFTATTNMKSVGMWVNKASGKLWGRGVESSGNQRSLPQSTTLTPGQCYIITQDFDGSTIGQYVNSTLSSNISYNNTLQSWTDFGIGEQGDKNMNGNIAEVIVFKEHLNQAKRTIIENYLAAKYGQSLASNDFYTRDNPGNGDFDHHVAGIGQASDGSNHTESKGTGIVRISDPSSLANGSFLFWGEETKNPTYTFSTNTSNYTEQLNSKWRVSKTGGHIETVTVSFDISGINLTDKQSCSPLQLIVDNNNNFSSPTIYPLTISGSTATATGVSFNNNNYFTLRYIDQIVWDGSNFHNGVGSGNAPNSTNLCLKLTVKSGGAATLTFDAHVREVEVETGAILNVADGVLLETEDRVVINGTLDLLGEAQLIQNHTGTTANSGSGSFRIKQQGTTNLYNYNYWSAPVNRDGFWRIGYLEDATGTVNFTSALNPNPSTSPITLSSRWLYGFKGPIGDYNAWEKLSPTANLSPGVGFTMKGSGASTTEQEFVFRGIPNDGDYTISVTENTEFLIGNPYPSTLDANQFITDNLSVIDGSLYFWESFATNNSHYLANYEGGYATYNLMMPLPAVADASGLTSGNGTSSKPAPTQYINMGQGFFTTILNSGSLVFNNAQRGFARESANETIYFKTSTKNKQTINEDNRPKIWFSFTEPKGYTKIIGLGYDEKTTNGYDRGYDAKSYDSFKNDLYWVLNNERLVIQALPEIHIEDQLPLGIKVSDAGLYKFSISNMENVPDDLNIYLVDNIQNNYYNLRDGDVQLFLNSGTKSNQFSMAFKNENSLGTISFEHKNFFTSYNNNNKILALHTEESLENVQSLKIFNLVGQEVLSIHAPQSYLINLSQLNDGVYVLKAISKTIENAKSIKFVKY